MKCDRVKTWFTALVIVLFCSCTKEHSVSPRMYGFEEGNVLLPKPRLPMQPLSNECVANYADFVDRMGGSEQIISAVILDDGTRIDVGGAIVSMVFRAEQSNQTLSLFRSIFDVTHMVGTIEHHVWWNVWSRGCYLQQPEDPHYTNLLRNTDVIQINSSFKWGLAPYQDRPISYLVIQ